jgi:hypothetical protein
MMVGMNADPSDVVMERLATLGLVIEWSTAMENTLRGAFCSLVGSKLAAVVAGGQSAAWLIGQCRALTDAHTELTDSARKAIKDALDLCEAANVRRNVLVHGIKLPGPADSFMTARSRPRTHLPAAQSWTRAELLEAAMIIAEADSSLFAAMQDAVGKELMRIGGLLTQEHHMRQWELRQERARLSLSEQRGCSTDQVSDEDVWTWIADKEKQ